MSRCYEAIDSDQKLLHAIDMYGDIWRLSVQVCVIRKDGEDHIHDIGRLENMPCVLQGSTDAPANQTIGKKVALERGPQDAKSQEKCYSSAI